MAMEAKKPEWTIIHKAMTAGQWTFLIKRPDHNCKKKFPCYEIYSYENGAVFKVPSPRLLTKESALEVFWKIAENISIVEGIKNEVQGV